MVYIYRRWMCGIELMIDSSVLINLGPSKYVLFIDKDRDVCTIILILILNQNWKQYYLGLFIYLPYTTLKL